MAIGNQFVDAFLTAYADAKRLFQGAAWEQLWKLHWNRFMLWNPLPPQERPVLRMTADRMGLTYWDREPFRVDAAFVRPEFRAIGNLPLPLVVAIEHENDFRTFDQEIAKLSHVRCPLKVGITYSLLSVPARDVELDALQLQMKTWLREINDRIEIGEAPDAEYLYLIGVEKPVLTLEWYAFTYTAGGGSEAGVWKTVAG